MIVLLITYLVSTVGAYLAIRRIFGPGGEWEVLSPGATELFLMFLPGFNTFVSSIGIISVIMKWIDSLNFKIDYNKFFRIKK